VYIFAILCLYTSKINYCCCKTYYILMLRYCFTLLVSTVLNKKRDTMIQIAEGILELPKAVIADLFGVSRSAVTQSCRNRSTQEDVIKRIYNYFSRRITNSSALVHNIQQESVFLLKDVRDVVAKRNVERVKPTGRPLKKFNFTEIKRAIRAIVAELVQSHCVVTARTPIVSQKTPSAPRTRKLRDNMHGMTAEEYEKFLDEYDSRAGKPIPVKFGRGYLIS